MTDMNRIVTDIPGQGIEQYLMRLDGWMPDSGSDSRTDGPMIDLSGKFSGDGVWVSPTSGSNKSRWMVDFVNHLGLSETERNPNAALRLHIPVSSDPAPRLSSLDIGG